MKTIHRFNARLTAAFALAALIIASATCALAGTDTWTGGTSGVWETSANWNSSSGPAPGTTDTAYFNGTGGGTNTLTFSGADTLDNITFDVGASSYTIGTTGGSTLTLTSGGTIQTTAADTNAQTINEPISLGGNYTFASNSTVSTNATLKFGGTIALGANTLTLAGGNTGSNAISGVVSGTGGITKSGNGTWILSGANTYTGTTTVGGGTLQVNGNTGSLASGKAFAFDGGTFDYNNSNASGANVQTIGTLTVSSGANTIENAETGGGSSALTLGNTTALSRTVGSTMNFVTTGGATITAGSGGVALNSGIFYNGSYAFATNNGAIGAIVYGNTYGAVTTTNITGSSLPTPSNDVFYNLEASATGGGGSGTGSTEAFGATGLTLTANGRLITGGFLVNGGSSGYSDTITSTNGGFITGITSGGGEVVFMTSGANDNLTVSAPFENINSSDDATVVKSGLGTLILSGTNEYSGVTYVNQGTLETTISNNVAGGALGFGGSTDIKNVAPGTAIVSGGGTLNLAATTANTTIDEAITLTGGNLSNSSTAHTATLDNGIAGIELLATGTNATTTANYAVTFSGGGGSGAAANVSTTSNSGITGLQTTAAGSGYTSTPTASFANAPGLTGSSNTVILSSLTLNGTGNTIGGAGNIDINAVIADGTSPGGFTKTGADTLTLTGSNTYTGTTTISAGTLQLGNGSAGNDGTIAGASIVNNANLVFDRFGSSTYNGTISGMGAVTMTGEGTQILSGVNTYTGATTVYSGTLQVSGSTYHLGQVTVDGGATLAGTGSVGNVTLNAGGVIDLQNGSIGSLTVNSLVLGGGLTSLIDLDIQTSGSTTTVDSIDDTGSLTLNPFATINIGNLVGTTNLTDGTYTLISDTSLSGSDSITNDTNTVSDLTLRGTAEGDGQTLSLVEGTNDSIDLDVTAPTQYTINTTTLNSYAGNSNHPRLFFNKGTGAGSISALAQAITSNSILLGTNTLTGTPRWSQMWSAYKNYADYAAIQPPANYYTPNNPYPPLAQDEQLWQRAVGDSMAILAMAYVVTSTNTTISTDTIWLEAEDAPLNAPMSVVTTSSTNVSCGAYIWTSNTVGTNTNDILQPPSASYYFSNHNTGAYYVWARVYAPSSAAHSWFFNIDGPTSTNEANPNPNPANYFNPSATTYGSWTWVESGPFYLTPGNHVMNLVYQTGGVEFDKFAITTNSALDPSNTTPFGIEQHWLEARNFQLNANGTGTNLYNLLPTTYDGVEPYGDAVSVTQQWLESWVGNTGASQPTSTNTPDAEQTISTNGNTNYDIWVRMKVPFKGHGSFWFEYDTAGYSTVTAESTNVAFPYNTLIPAQYLAYNKGLSSPNNGYPYREWVWVKTAGNVSLPAGSHILKASNESSDGNASCQIDRFLVQPTGTVAPTDPNKYLGAAQQWANASCNYPTWGTGDYDGNDLAASHQLQGLGILYDWCYSSLGAADLATIGNKLSTQEAVMNTGATTAWWKNSFLMNHLWEDTTGLTTAALAIYGDTNTFSGTNTLPTEATEQTWLNTALTKLNNTMTDLEEDGAHQEGPGYFGYGLEHLLKYTAMANKLMGINMYGTPWFEQAATYRLYFDLPADEQTANLYTNINFSDDPGYDWYGPDYLLRGLASLYNIPTAQWQAEHYDFYNLNGWDNAPNTQGSSPWLNLVWYNPNVPETSPATAGPNGGSIPTLGYFSDLDFVVSRSGWTGTESVLAYQCGPPMGHGVQAKNKTDYVDWGSNHVHAAASNFCLFGGGSWLILNSGYSGEANNDYGDPFKLSSVENTLEVNGAGQLGEVNDTTFNGSAARGEDPGGVLNPAVNDTLSYSTAEMDYIVGNATACYTSSDDLTKYERHLLYLKPSNMLVVVDDVAATANDAFQLNFHPTNVAPTTLVAGSSYSTTASNGAQLDFSVLTTSNSTITTSNVTWADGAGNHWTYQVSPKSGSTNSWSDAVALAWSTTNTTPNTVTMITDPDNTAWKFKVGTETMVLDRNVTSYAPDEIARAVTTLEAESGTLSSQMVIGDTNTASQDEYITTVSGLSLNNPNTLTSPSASYTFNAPVAGTYAIWARVLAANASSNSFWYAVNPGAGSTYTNSVSTPTYGNWVWVELTPSASLTAGTNTLGIQYEAPNCCIDQIIITGDTLYNPTYIY